MRYFLLFALPFVFASNLRAELPEGAIARLEAKPASPVVFVGFLSDGRVVTAGHKSALSAGGGGPVMVALREFTLRCWEIRTAREVATQSLDFDDGPFTFGSTGRGFLFATRAGLKEWQPGKELGILPDATKSGFVAFAGDGSTWSQFGDKAITSRRLSDGKKLADVPPPGATIANLTLSPHGRYVAFTSRYGPRALQIWEIDETSARRMRSESGVAIHPQHLRFSPDARLLVSLSGNGVAVVLEAATDRVRNALTLPSPASTVVEVGVDFARATLPKGGGDTASTVEFSPDGRYLAVGHATGLLYLHDRATGRHTKEFTGHRGAINAVAFSADGSLLASAGVDGTTLVWNVATLRAALPPVPADRFSPDAAWTGLAAQDAKVGDAAIWALAGAPKEALAMFREWLKPVNGPDKTAVDRWLAELDGEKFAAREKAYQNLLAAGPAIKATLETAMSTTTSLEVRGRIGRLLEKIGDRLPADRVRALRALEVIDRIGTPEARALVELLAKSTDEEVRREVEFLRRRWK